MARKTADYHDRSADATSRAHAQRQRCLLPNTHRNELTFVKMDLFRKYLGAQQGDQLPSGVETVSVLPKTISTFIHTFWTLIMLRPWSASYTTKKKKKKKKDTKPGPETSTGGTRRSDRTGGGDGGPGGGVTVTDGCRRR